MTATPTLIEPAEIKAAITRAREQQKLAVLDIDLRLALTCQRLIDVMLDRLNGC